MVYDAEHIGYRDCNHDAEQQQYGRAGKFYVWGVYSDRVLDESFWNLYEKGHGIPTAVAGHHFSESGRTISIRHVPAADRYRYRAGRYGRVLCAHGEGGVCVIADVPAHFCGRRGDYHGTVYVFGVSP